MISDNYTVYGCRASFCLMQSKNIAFARGPKKHGARERMSV